jgi:hypothetical protein
MSAGLFGFVFNTLRKRANDPANAKFWLPAKLQSADGPFDGKLLPVTGRDWSIGEIQGEAGTTSRSTIGGQWWIIATSKKKGFDDEMPIACPDQPWPVMTLPEVTVTGLENVYVMGDPAVEQPGTGYRATLTVQFGYYDPRSAPSLTAPVTVTGRYAMVQCQCSARKSQPTVCDGKLRDRIEGRGTFIITMSDLYADVSVDLAPSGSASDRTLRAAVTNIGLRGKTPGSNPVLAVKSLTIESLYKGFANSIWKTQATKALTSDDGTRGLLNNLNAALNQPANLTKLSQMLSDQLARILDSALGAVPPGRLPSLAGQQAPNPADQYVFDRIRYALNDPASDYYLPKIVVKSQHPQLEPYTTDSIALGDQSYEGMQFQNLRITQLVVNGLSNAAAPADTMVFRPDAIDARVGVGVLGAPPTVTAGGRTLQVPAPPLQIAGLFSMQVAGDGGDLGGRITIRVNNATVDASVDFSGQELAELQVIFKRLTIAAANPDVSVTLQVDSAFSDIMNAVVNQDSVKQQVLEAINQRAAGSLGSISTDATNDVRRLVAAQLDG